MGRKLTRKGLVKKLDDLHRAILFREWGQHCVQCGSTKQLGRGHVFSCRNYLTRWDYHPGGNCYPQCWPCNFRHVRDQYPYFKWFEEKFGKQALDDLRVRWKITRPVKNWELEEKVEEFKCLIQKNK